MNVRAWSKLVHVRGLLLFSCAQAGCAVHGSSSWPSWAWAYYSQRCASGCLTAVCMCLHAWKQHAVRLYQEPV